MSILSFLLRAIAITPQVVLRFLPIFIAYTGAMVVLVLTTQNVWVLGLVGFLLATIGFAFVIVSGLRAALQALKLTSAPTADGIFIATVRMVFIYGLIQLIMIAGSVLVIWALYQYVILPTFAPGLMATISAIASQSEPPLSADEVLATLQGGEFQVLLSAYALLAICFSLSMAAWGVPMAASAANAVQHTPGHDMIFGLGRYMPHQVVTYFIGSILPSMCLGTVTSALAPDLASAGLPVTIAVCLLLIFLSLFTMCIPWSGMALAYGEICDKIVRERAAERVPVIDYEAERESVRTLRQARTEEKTIHQIYDPHASR